MKRKKVEKVASAESIKKKRSIRPPGELLQHTWNVNLKN